MALTIEDGSVVAGANSFANVAYADAYFLTTGMSSWAAATTEDKETALVRAMDYLESQDWVGHIKETLQPLCFPRVIWGQDLIPDKLKKAQCELALRELDVPRSTLPDITRDDFVKTKKVDIITTEYHGNVKPRFQVIRSLLKGLLRRHSNSAWVEF